MVMGLNQNNWDFVKGSGFSEVDGESIEEPLTSNSEGITP